MGTEAYAPVPPRLYHAHCARRVPQTRGDWVSVDIVNGSGAILNLIALLALSPVVIKLLNDYDAKKPYKRDDYLNNRS